MKTKIFWIAFLFAVVLNIIFTIAYPQGWWNVLNFFVIGTMAWSRIQWKELWLAIKSKL